VKNRCVWVFGADVKEVGRPRACGFISAAGTGCRDDGCGAGCKGSGCEKVSRVRDDDTDGG